MIQCQGLFFESMLLGSLKELGSVFCFENVKFRFPHVFIPRGIISGKNFSRDWTPPYCVVVPKFFNSYTFRIILYNIAEGIINIAKVFIYEVDDNNESKSETQVKLKSLKTALEKLIRDFPPAFYGVHKFPCSEAFKNLYQMPVHSNFVKGLIKRVSF